MKKEPNPASEKTDPTQKLAPLVRKLSETQRQLQLLTGGEVDAVLSPDGQSYLLQEAQEKLRQSEAAQRGFAALQLSILNALPAHIALIDRDGVILSINDRWRDFAGGDGLQSSVSSLGQNYLEICDRAHGNYAGDAHQAAAGIRAVLTGAAREFSLEYPCHTPTDQRWFRLMVAPLDKDRTEGAAVMHIDITERKLEQEKVRQSEERFRNMFTTAATGIAVSTPQGRFLHANAAYCKMVGYTEAELRELNFAALTHPDDLNLNLELRDDMLAGRRESFLMEKRYLKKNGDVVWTRHSVSATHTTGGEIATLMVVAEDITERKVAEEELQRRQIELQALFDLMPAMVWFKDTANGVIQVNQRAAEATGKSVGEIVGRSMRELYPNEAAKYYADDLEVIESRAPKLGIVEKLRGAEDRDLWVQTDKVPVCDKTGKVLGIIVMVQDITERKKTEESLTLFRTLIEGIPDAIEVIEPETGRYLDINETGCQRLGYSREEMLAMNVADIGVERDYWAVWPAVAEEIKKTGFATIFERHRRKDGSTFPVEVNARYINLNQGYFVAVVRDITERKRNEARLRRLIDSNVQGVFFWNTRGEIFEANDALLGIVGYTRDDLKAGRMNWAKMTPPELVERDQQALREVTARGVCEPYEKEYIRKDGARVPVLIGPAIFDDSPDEGVCFVVDISKRKAAEEALRLSEERFSKAVEYAPIGMALVAPDGKFLTVNRALCDLVGYSFLELPTKTFQEITHPDDLQQDLESFDQLLAGEISFYKMEKRYVHKQGHLVWIHLSVSLVRDSAGQPLYLIAQIQDITGNKIATDKIVEQAALINEASDAIVVRDLNHRVTFWSKGAERIFDWTSEEALGRLLPDLLKPDAAKFAEAVRVLLETGTWNDEIPQQAKSGATLSVHARWTLLRDVKGQPRSILAIETDITERKKLEQQFLRAQRMESIGTLAGGIAHDLNNILAPILMSIDILKLTATDPQSSSILETIGLSAKRGADIVRQVLSFARGIEGERMEVQAGHLLKDLEHIIKDTFPKDIRLHFSIPRETFTLWGDPTQIHQILLNLCVNARDAMPNGGNLTVSAENCTLDEQYVAMNLQARAGRYVLISVTDTGTGIPPAIVEKIFEPFFTTKELNKGTGLGLSTVMAIVKSHDGIINVYSEPGKGTTFKVYLPALETASEAQARQTQSVDLPRGNGESVLIVDDEASVITITGKTLQAFGYRVLTASNGANAVATYAQHKKEIAVVLTDVMMPIMDGPAMIQALRQINPLVKVIATSGLNANENLTRVSGAGIKHFLTKPYTAGTLLKTLRTILDEVA